MATNSRQLNLWHLPSPPPPRYALTRLEKQCPLPAAVPLDTPAPAYHAWKAILVEITKFYRSAVTHPNTIHVEMEVNNSPSEYNHTTQRRHRLIGSPSAVAYLSPSCPYLIPS